MQLDWARPGVLRATGHAFEFATLVSAARYVAESAPPDIPQESLEQLERVLRDYDTQTRRLHGPLAPDGQ
ncbi:MULTISPECIES: hypothetical protein [unclassified Streptomyces]|uniref:hypothetical protein n=1 Tax=unclassified Streptomyces TaxID=2593676 RepID=UPI000CD5880B|nr:MULTISPECIES: hypothetical protein [unclassified Streptomyces]MCI4043577.1 hypothetical protein [Streptomyces sp. TRM75563]